MEKLKELFFDLETKRWSTEVPGGWSNIPAFGLSVGITTWNDNNIYRKWLESEANLLFEELKSADKVIGYNIIEFDYEVLGAYITNIHKCLDAKSFDIMLNLKAKLGFRLSLDDLCSATLSEHKLGKAEDAVKWFRQGEIDKVVRYCQGDVELTRKIYRYGQKHGYIYYPRYGQPVKLQIDWG